MPADCVTLWIGDRLGALERACLRSVVRQGHRVSLFCYEKPDGIPEGVEIRDAAELIPAERIVRHANGSVSLFSNHFRYELLRRGLGTWIDCDAYLLAPLDGMSPFLFGEEEHGRIAIGILRMPPDSPILAGLIDLFREKMIPAWLPPRARMAARWRLARTGRTDIARMPWGSLGPQAVTALLRAHGVDHFALPASVFYPVHWRDAEWLLSPGTDVSSVISAGTVSIHLWNERIKHLKDKPAPAGSFLARLQAEGA